MKKIKEVIVAKLTNNYFDNIKRARAFAAKNSSKVEIVNLDSTRRYLVKTEGKGLR